MLNSVLLEGFLKQDPLVITGRGIRMCEMLIRTGRRPGPETVRITVRAYGGLDVHVGETCRKGDKVRVVGALRQTYRKDQYGKLREWMYIKADAVQKISIDRKDAVQKISIDRKEAEEVE
jgi:single-stranded DNA-binding protein